MNFFLDLKTVYILILRAPKIKSDKLLPVMFWIHGGGNTSGLKIYMIFQKWLEGMM